MRRPVGFGLIGALALALFSTIAAASPVTLVPLPAFDLSAQLMLRLFGETTDSGASLAAAYGDRNSESPLRDLALPVLRTRETVAFMPDLASAPTFARASGTGATGSILLDVAQTIGNHLSSVGAPFMQSSPSRGDDAIATMRGGESRAAASFTVGAYQPVAAAPIISPGPGAFSFGPMAQVSAETAESGSLNPALPSATNSSVYAPSTVRVGRVQFEGDVEGASTQVPQVSLRDSAYGAGANFSVRAGARNVNVNLSSGYEQLMRNDTSTVSAPALGATSSWQLPGAAAPLVIPNYADMNKLSVGAGVAVPVFNGLTLNLNYDAQRLYGGYGLPGLANLDAIGNSYGGKLVFEIPHLSSTLSISAGQYRYQDNVLPLNSTTETRADVNFMVKF